MKFQLLQPKDKKVRRLPFPFDGAISISSDIEYMDFNFFEQFMEFVNTKNSTALGTGLGLELTSSMFFYSVDGRTFSYFKGSDHDAPVSEDANRINDYLQAGWIDTNHSYGDFFLSDKFTRNHAIRCFDMLNELGVCLPVFTNHGGNSSNFGSQSPIYQGDVAGSNCYNADLLAANNLRYMWLDVGMCMLEHQPWTRIVKHWIKQLIGRGHEDYINNREALFKTVELRDKSTFKSFVRLRGTGRYAPDFSSLGIQLKQIDWQKFYKSNGLSIIYQHLGVMSQNDSKCISSNIENILSRKEVFLAPLYFLKRESDLGKLWLCGTARLLNYAEVVESAIINYDSARNRYDVALDFDHQVKPQTLLQGLTFYIDPNKPVDLYYNGEKINILYNGPDKTGKYSVSVPIQPLKDIWERKK